ncbi:MAG TPA: hypothetical protein VN688_18100 [Gemmataceae bacterium]|nr:hypothetical protein [Gemmataceae bacterium]
MDTLATLQVYKELADWYERQGQAAMRDRFLILAAEAAFSAGKPEEAERLRQRLLQGNPHHMLKPFSSFSQALQSTNIQIYIHDLQVNYPPETAEGLLQGVRGNSEATIPNAVPQTAPLIELRDEPTLPLGGSMEALKVYPLREEPSGSDSRSESEPRSRSESDRTRSASVPSTGGTPVKPARKPTAAPPIANPPRSSTLNPTVPLAQPAMPRSSAPSRPALALASSPPLTPEPAAPGGAWLTLLLFGMTVTAGVALAVYTLARPFLPREWLP